MGRYQNLMPVKNTTKPPPTLPYNNKIMDNSRYLYWAPKLLGDWWKNHILPPPDKEHANMAIVEEPRNLREAIQSNATNNWELDM